MSAKYRDGSPPRKSNFVTFDLISKQNFEINPQQETMSIKSRRLIAKLSSNSDTSTASTSSQAANSPLLTYSPPAATKQRSTFSSMSFQRNSMNRSSRYRPVTNVPYWFINLSGPSRPTNKINGKFQSPINLASDDAIYDPTLAESPLTHHYQLTADFELINTGYVLQLSLRPRQISTPQPTDVGIHEGSNGFSQRSFRSQSKLGQESILTGGPLEPNSEYQLIDVIFHWGKDEKRGSEHTVNFKSYPMEVQLIHWNCTLYSSYEEAMGKEHGICICALFVQIGNENPTINSIIEHLVDISFGGFSKRITSEHKFTLNPSTFLPDPTLRDYWVYPGSLTIPPCHENVTWILYRYPLTVSPKQRMAFCNLLTITKGQGQAPIAGNEGQMVDNFRPNQALCGRKIKSSFKP